jgi:hypothetical protein
VEAFFRSFWERLDDDEISIYIRGSHPEFERSVLDPTWEWTPEGFQKVIGQPRIDYILAITWDENWIWSDIKISQIDTIVEGLGITEKSERERCALVALRRKKIKEAILAAIPNYLKSFTKFILPDPIYYEYSVLPDEEVSENITVVDPITKKTVATAENILQAWINALEDYFLSEHYQNECKAYAAAKEKEALSFIKDKSVFK